MQLNQGKSSNNWTNEDFLAGACSHLEIGRPKNQAIVPAEPIDLPQEELSLKELRNKAVALALQTPNFFEDDPTFHKRFLLAIAKSNEPTGTEAQIHVNISWLSPNRLAYKQDNVVDASDPMDVEPRALPSVPSPTPEGSWKEPQPEVIGINSLIKSLK